MKKEGTVAGAGRPAIDSDGLRSAIAVAAAAASIVFLACLAATLEVSSPWLDELYTLHFSDPSLGLEELIRQRLSTDSNPPLYYLLIYGLRALAGTSIGVVRAFSIGVAVLMAAALFFGTRGIVSRSGRCLLVFLAATSPAVLIYAHEARGYMLMMALATLACLLSLRIIRERHRPPPAKQLVALATVWLLLAATHHFGFLFGGALVAALLLERRAAPGTARLIGVGTLVSLVVVPFYALQLAAVRANAMTTSMVSWITSEPSFVAANSMGGLHLGFGGPIELTVVAALLVLSGAAGFRRSGATGALPGEHCNRLAILRVLLLAAVLTLAGSLIITLLVVPIITYRNLLVVAPALWLAVAVGIDGQWASAGRAVVAALCSGMLLLIGVRLARLELAFEPDKEVWRASAEFIRKNLPCDDVSIAVASEPQTEPYWEILELVGGTARLHLHPILEPTLVDADSAVRRASLRRSVPATAQCVAIWCVCTFSTFQAISRLADDVRAEWGDRQPPEITVFEHQSCDFSWSDPECVISPRHRVVSAFVILAR